MFSILSKGLPGFFQYYITLEVELDRERLDPAGDLSDQSLFDGQAKKIIQEAILAETGAKKRKEKRQRASCYQTDLTCGLSPMLKLILNF